MHFPQPSVHACSSPIIWDLGTTTEWNPLCSSMRARTSIRTCGGWGCGVLRVVGRGYSCFLLLFRCDTFNFPCTVNDVMLERCYWTNIALNLNVVGIDVNKCCRDRHWCERIFLCRRTLSVTGRTFWTMVLKVSGFWGKGSFGPLLAKPWFYHH